MKPKVWVVDDEETIRKLLKTRLERDGFEVELAADGSEAKTGIQGDAANVAVVVTDLKMPGTDGFSLMTWAKEFIPRAKWIMITGHGDKEVAIKALKAGASDYLEKPFDLDELSHAVDRCMREWRLMRENHDLVSRLEARLERVEGKPEDKYWFVSKAPSMKPVNEWMTVLRRESMRGNAEEPAVLILGESGTGKEGIARMVHAGSRRGKGPWVAVNCANFSEQLLESELFGHERGSFTGATTMKRGLFEIARGGTLFLDEIGEMDSKVQAKLLRVLQEKTFRRLGGTSDLESDVRVVAATHRALQQSVKEGKFREDLYHRLSRVVIELPALRERKEDIVPMAREFSERAFSARGKHFSGFASDAEQMIQTYAWPGNVRELLNVIERCALLAETTGQVSAAALGLKASGLAAVPRESNRANSVPELPDVQKGETYTQLKRKWVYSFEKEFLTHLLKKHEGNVSAAAREAGLDRSNTLRLIRRHGLDLENFREITKPGLKIAA